MEAAFLINPGFWSESAIWSPGAPPDFIEVLMDEPGLDGHVFFETSGSTGAPKRIALAKQALLLSAAAVNRHLQVTERSCWGLALPMHHVGGFGVAARAFEAACDLAEFEGKWDAKSCADWLAEDEVTHLSLVPAQVHDLVKAGLRAPACLRAIVVGGGKLDDLLGRAARDLGWPVLASYGMTEAGSQIATQTLDLLRLPYQTNDLPVLPIWQTRLADNGCLEISGPALFSGTVEKVGGKWRYTPRADKWHRTSDRVELADGTLTPLGRDDAKVKVLGELVDVPAIESEIQRIADDAFGVNQFAIVPMPDERAGYVLVPVFAASISREQALSWITYYNSQAPGFRRLKDPVLLTELPLSGLGKIRRGELASMLRNI